jgi:SAM-dependent methyltransferase
MSGSADAVAHAAADREVIWHDLECGGYRTDLPLWRKLAEEASRDAPGEHILEIGAGTGRVTVDLARAGHRVTAVDLDLRLLDALRARAGGLDVEVACADARSLDLRRRDFGLCLVPMQTVQLLGGEAGRVEFMRRARAHLRPGGVLACAIVSDFECFDCSLGEDGPSPEFARIGGSDYVSRAIRVAAAGDSFVIERVRSVLPARGRTPRSGSAVRLRASSLRARGERDVIELDVLDVAQLEREAIAAGLAPGAHRRVPATDEHLASDVVILHA